MLPANCEQQETTAQQASEQASKSSAEICMSIGMGSHSYLPNYERLR